VVRSERLKPGSGGTRRRRLVIGGRVQGVGFRISCARSAETAGVSGWVRNLPDGRVEVVLEGTGEAVAEVEAWCARGPRMARVTKVDATDEPPGGEKGFEIR
jgi:acylphosphatase